MLVYTCQPTGMHFDAFAMCAKRCNQFPGMLKVFSRGLTSFSISVKKTQKSLFFTAGAGLCNLSMFKKMYKDSYIHYYY